MLDLASRYFSCKGASIYGVCQGVSVCKIFGITQPPFLSPAFLGPPPAHPLTVDVINGIPQERISASRQWSRRARSYRHVASPAPLLSSPRANESVCLDLDPGETERKNSFSFLSPSLLEKEGKAPPSLPTGPVCRMTHRKWRETKQQLI